MGYRPYCHLLVVPSLPSPPLPILVFMLLYGTAQRPFKNHWLWSKGLYLGPYSSKERDLCVMKFARSLVWAMHCQAWVLMISLTPSAHRLTLELQDHSHLHAFTITLLNTCFTRYLEQNYSLLAHYCTLIWFRPLYLGFSALQHLTPTFYLLFLNILSLPYL